jgi:hypothetical protein
VDNIYGIHSDSRRKPTIYNCILWGNGDDLRYCNATFSCIKDNDDGPGNIHDDPLFVNNFHIDILSPCINAGDPDPSRDYHDQTDIDGEPRVLEGRVDIGADETHYQVASDPPIYPDAHWWKLDEGSGTTAGDSVGDSNGTFNGGDPSWVDGLIGGAVDFDGVDDYFSVPSLNETYEGGSIFTAAGWFNTSQSTGMQTILGSWWQDGVWFDGWQVLVENKKVVARFSYDDMTMTDIIGTSDVNDGKWHHFAMVHNGTNIAVYVDGQPEKTGTANFSTYDTKFRIGSINYDYPPLKGGPFNGMIDDVMIFNRVISAEEVEQLYQEGL